MTTTTLIPPFVIRSDFSVFGKPIVAMPYKAFQKIYDFQNIKVFIPGREQPLIISLIPPKTPEDFARYNNGRSVLRIWLKAYTKLTNDEIKNYINDTLQYFQSLLN